MCDCLKVLDAKLKAEFGARVDALLDLSGGPAKIAIHTSLIEKKRGASAPFISPTFCPVCGEKYA